MAKRKTRKTTNNKLEKSTKKPINSAIDRHRNCENLWFLKNYPDYIVAIPSSPTNKHELLLALFEVLCLPDNAYRNMGSNDLVTQTATDLLEKVYIKHPPILNDNKATSTELVSYCESCNQHLNEDISQMFSSCRQNSHPIFVLDKHSNLVYDGGKLAHYGFYTTTQITDRNHALYEKTKLTRCVNIYNKDLEKTYEVYPYQKCFLKCPTVFEEFQEITRKEHLELIHELDADMNKVMDTIETHNNDQNALMINNEELKDRLRNIIKKVYYSQLDFSEETYSKIHNYLDIIQQEEH